MKTFEKVHLPRIATSALLLSVALWGLEPYINVAVATAADEHRHDSSHGDSDDHDSHGGEHVSDERADGNHNERGENAHGGEHHGEDVVTLSASQMEEFGVEVARAGSGQITTHSLLPGEVLPNADRVAHIVPRYAGIVKEVRKRVGDTVETGDVLAVLESSATLTAYELRTLLSGTVIAKHITRGEAVTRETQAFLIADLSDVWIALSIYQRDLARVKVGQRVLLSTGHHLPDAEGTISYVSPVVDEETRTSLARIVMDNSSGAWRPGMFVTGRVAVDAIDVALALPLTALQTIDGRTVVFVEGGNGFEPREVTIGRRSRTHAEVASGLSVGERYVAKGGFILKAELGRSELSEGHSH